MSEALALKLEIDAKGASKTLGDLERASEALNDELKQTAVGSDAFKKLKSELIGVNSEIKNVELSMESLDNEQVASEMGSVTGAIGDMTGAFMLLGGESETMQEMAANIQMAMGVSMGLKGAIEGLSSAKKLWNHHMKSTNILTALNTKLTKATTIAQKALGFSTDSTTKSFKLMRGALIATGIGALVVLIGTLISQWDNISAALSTTTARQRALNETMDEYSAGAEEAVKKVNQVKSSFDLAKQGIISKEEALKDYNDTFGDSLGVAKDINEAESIFIAKTGAYIESQALRAQAEILLQKSAEATVEGITASMESQVSTWDLMMASFQMGFGDTKTAVTTMVESHIAGTKTLEDESNKQAKILSDLAQQKLTEANNVEAEFEINDEKEIERNKEQVKKKVEVNKVREVDTREHLQRIEAVEIEHEDKILQIRKLGFGESMLASEKYYEGLEEQRKLDLAREQEIKQAKIDMAMGSIDALMNITNAFAKGNEKSQKRAFEINKKLQMAQALIGTYQGVQAIFTSAAMNPASVLFPAMPYIQAAIALASGLANVKNISKQQFQSGSVGGSGPTFSGSLGGGTSAPTLNPISNTNTVLGQDNKVYVTETDISNTQNKVKVIEEQATF